MVWHLQLLGRWHTAQEAKEAVRMAQEAGFGNISIDHIYGIPGQTIEQWQNETRQWNISDIREYSS